MDPLKELEEIAKVLQTGEHHEASERIRAIARELWSIIDQLRVENAELNRRLVEAGEHFREKHNRDVASTESQAQQKDTVTLIQQLIKEKS